MAQQIATCPKCKVPIFIVHDYSWCQECGDTLPDDIRAKLPKLQKIATDAAAARVRLGLSTDADINSAGRGLRTASIQVLSVISRYRDAYLVARAVNGYGSVIKVIAVLIGLVSLIIGISVAGNARSGDPIFSIGILLVIAGVIAGISLYVVGVIVAAQGQILKASLDSAVNSSPFLTNEHRAEVMSLPKP